MTERNFIRHVPVSWGRRNAIGVLIWAGNKQAAAQTMECQATLVIRSVGRWYDGTSGAERAISLHDRDSPSTVHPSIARCCLPWFLKNAHSSLNAVIRLSAYVSGADCPTGSVVSRRVYKPSLFELQTCLIIILYLNNCCRLYYGSNHFGGF